MDITVNCKTKSHELQKKIKMNCKQWGTMRMREVLEPWHDDGRDLVLGRPATREEGGSSGRKARARRWWSLRVLGQARGKKGNGIRWWKFGTARITPDPEQSTQREVEDHGEGRAMQRGPASSDPAAVEADLTQSGGEGRYTRGGAGSLPW